MLGLALPSAGPAAPYAARPRRDRAACPLCPPTLQVLRMQRVRWIPSLHGPVFLLETRPPMLASRNGAAARARPPCLRCELWACFQLSRRLQDSTLTIWRLVETVASIASAALRLLAICFDASPMVVEIPLEGHVPGSESELTDQEKYSDLLYLDQTKGYSIEQGKSE